MQKTAIEWTDFSANPLKYRRKSDGKSVWACVKKSPGCANCYSETIAMRWDRGKLFNAANMDELEPFLDEKEIKAMLTKKKVDGKDVAGSKCFVGDMTDIFGEWVPNELLDRLFAVFAVRRDVIWQVLTKRADRMASYWTDGIRNGRGEHTDMYIARETLKFAEQLGLSAFERDVIVGVDSGWPSNVWAGVSVEDQKRADERIPHFLKTPATVRFLSCEPLLGQVDLSEWLYTMKVEHNGDGDTQEVVCRPDLHQIIVGGESGKDSRPCNFDHIALIVKDCKEAEVPCFVKQVGSKPVFTCMNLETDARKYSPTVWGPIKDPKGGVMEEWPEHLRVRQFPVL